MSTIQELKEALQDNLRASGTLDRLEAYIRAQVFQALDHVRLINIECRTTSTAYTRNVDPQ